MAPGAAVTTLSPSTSTAAPSSSKSIADLTTRLASAKGDVPPPLIGASTTLVNNRVYVFGGRLTESAHVQNQVYVLDLGNGVWTHVVPKHQQQDQQPPKARYFHSATAINNHCIVFFGGITIAASNGGELRSLGDLFILHISDDSEQLCWEFPTNAMDDDITITPHPRHSHLAMAANNDRHLVILGGQDVNSGYIDEINVYDCKKQIWYPRIATQSHYTSYETAAATLLPISASASATMGSPNFLKVFSDDHNGQQEDSNEDGTQQQQQQTLTTTTTLFAYSNENIHGVHRRLHQITVSASGHVESITDYTAALSTSRQYAPPALRAMGSAACGQFLIMFGACTTSDPHHMQIWALNISTMMWTKIDAGPRLINGSWLCGVFRKHAERNELIVFGHPDGALHEDYTQRVVHYDYWITIDTEAFGVYNPPYITCGTFAQDAGLALLNNPALSDLTIVTTDGQRARANSTILAQRWSSIRDHLEPLLSPSSSSPAMEVYASSQQQQQQPLPSYILTFPETYDILIAFLQFIYTDHLTTVEQNQPRILTRLLILADLFDIARLKSLACHSLHQMLQISTAPSIYQTAALANCWSLQVRALRIMVNAKKLMQQQQQQQHPPSPKPVKMEPTSYTLHSRPSSPSTQPMDDPFKNFGAASLIAATGSSSSYQPLSRLLRQYDLDAPLPPVNPVVSDSTTQQAPSTSTASPSQPSSPPPPVQAKNPARKRENSASSTITATPTIKKNYRNAPVWLPMSF